MEVIEKAGSNLKSRLQKSNPFPDNTCPDPECILCENNSNSMCRRNNVTYEVKCDLCKDIYIGETSRNLYTRIKEHLSDYRNKSKDSVLYRHAVAKHSHNQHVPYTAKVTGVHRDALSRQLTEAVSISEACQNTLINSKAEFGHTPVTRVQLTLE